MATLSQFCVPGPPKAYYIPNFVDEEEEQLLLRKVSPLRPSSFFAPA
jgi:hypothetical protein